MKIKQTPDDFQVEEISSLTPGDGPYALYRLTKRGSTTPAALDMIRKRFRIRPGAIAYGGLKDRHAHTSQYFTIAHGPRKGLQLHDIKVEYLGQAEQACNSSHIQANQFTLTLRALGPVQVEQAEETLPEIREVGVANYFDDQRFSSVSEGRFVAREMVLEKYEDALRLALTAPYEHDRSGMKHEKEILAQHWGDWTACEKSLPHAKSGRIVRHLIAHPDDYLGGLLKLEPDLLVLYLSAWQSHLWNRMLARWIELNIPAAKRVTVDLRLGSFPMPRSMRAEAKNIWYSLALPYPSARLRLDPESAWAPLVEKVLEEEGIKLEQMKLRGLQKPFFSKGEREAAVRPVKLSHSFEKDDLNSGKRKLTLSFQLPAGAYATMVVKRLLQTRQE